MSWGSAGALTGLLLVALPVIIHLLGKDPATRRAFPTLRFIAASRLLPTRWSRIHDPLLLAVRCAVLAAAVVALARPYRRQAAVSGDAASRVARVVLLDTSGVGYRENPGGARAVAQALVDSANTALLVTSNDPAGELQGAASWLAHEPGFADIVIVSDFASERYPANLPELVASSIGVRTVRIGSAGTASTNVGAPSVSWRASPAPAALSVDLIAAPQDADVRDAVLKVVARSVAADQSGGSVRAAVVLSGADGRTELLRSARAITSPSIVALAARLTRESFALPFDVDVSAPAVAASGQGTERVSVAVPASAVAVARTRDGAVALWAMEDSVTAGPRLLLFSTLPARSPVVAHVVAAVVEAIAPRESAIGAPVLADSVLQSWNRTPAAPVSAATRPATADAGASLARLLWCAVLLLLAAEWFVRRRISVAIVGLGGRDAER